MDANIIVTLIIGVLSSGALAALINNMFQNKRDKESKATGVEAKIGDMSNKIDRVIEDQKKQEGDILRVELKLMISDFPEKEEDILRLAQHYFNDLHANWVMAATFKQWLDQRGIKIPDWYNDTND